ncbi:MAG: hypothetical protein ACRDLK_09610 [Gaiellaceae bacterium]
MAEKKTMSSEEVTQHLLATDENFRQLYEIVKERNGGRIPSSAEIDESIQAWRARKDARRANS